MLTSHLPKLALDTTWSAQQGLATEGGASCGPVSCGQPQGRHPQKLVSQLLDGDHDAVGPAVFTASSHPVRQCMVQYSGWGEREQASWAASCIAVEAGGSLTPHFPTGESPG